MKINRSRASFIISVIIGLAAALIWCSPSIAANRKPAKIIIINKGVGGSSSADGLRRFQHDVAVIKPDLLIIYFGMNDAVNPGKLLSPEQFARNLQNLVKRSRQAGIRQLLLTTVNPIIVQYLLARHKDKYSNPDLNAKVVEINKVIRQIAAKNRIPLVSCQASKVG